MGSMSIRTNLNRKDHSRDSVAELVLVESPTPQIGSLTFWTSHPSRRTLVDLTILRDGQQISRGSGSSWTGPFSGRPTLLNEMLPVIQDHFAPLAEKSIRQIMVALKAWWRIFDSLERDAPTTPVLTSTKQLNELHRQRAMDQNIGRLDFSSFLLLANKSRVSMGLKPLYWQRPEAPGRSRKLPPRWQTDLLRRELKHRWFSVLDRWSLADELLSHGAPVVTKEQDAIAFVEQQRLLRGYQFLDTSIRLSAHPRPSNLLGRCSAREVKQYYAQGFDQLEMLQGLYPDGADVRTAFLLCMATTGWNPAVLLGLNAEHPFIESHPKDSSRFILRGFKTRGGTEQVTEGLFKTQASAATVLQTLMSRTEPLRAQLRVELAILKEELASSTDGNLNSLLERQQRLEEGIRSPWIYISIVNTGIHWLTNLNNKTSEFLMEFIRNINSKQPFDQQLAELIPTDLRDAYAAHTYNASGGSILGVMKALGHRRLSSTQIYLDNTLLREEHRTLYSTFSSALWSEIQLHGRVDPTVLAKWSRDGIITNEERERLYGYRNLMRTRLGVGCKNPTHPPKHIAPNFKPDGKTLCHVQRCLLCTEHAVIFPTSLSGLCKRLSELRHLRTQMSFASFTQSSFREELENTEAALMAFHPETVEQHLSEWGTRIANGTHRAAEFDGNMVNHA